MLDASHLPLSRCAPNRKPHSQFVASNIVCSFSVFLAYHAKRETLHTSISTDSEMSLYRSRVVPRDYSINFCFAYDSKRIRQKSIFLRIPLTRSHFSKDVGIDSNFSEYLLIKRFHCWEQKTFFCSIVLFVSWSNHSFSS